MSHEGERYWNILEKLSKLHKSDDTPSGSTPLIPVENGGE